MAGAGGQSKMRVTRCFAFLDLCGFTAFTEARGDAAAVAVLAQLRTLVRVNAESHGVRVTKWLGDGAMLSGIDGADVLDCARTAVERLDVEDGPHPRAGVCAGAVIMFEGDDYIGAAVNVAARLCDAAGPRQVLVASASLPPEVLADCARPLAPMALAGVGAPVEVSEVGAG